MLGLEEDGARGAASVVRGLDRGLNGGGLGVGRVIHDGMGADAQRKERRGSHHASRVMVKLQAWKVRRSSSGGGRGADAAMARSLRDDLRNFVSRSFYGLYHHIASIFRLRQRSCHACFISLHTSLAAMFQRSLLRASRQAAIRPAAFAPIRQQVARTRAAAPAIRWYSDAPAAKEGEAAEKKEDAPKDESAQLKEQLEKKDKEIVDLKVP